MSKGMTDIIAAHSGYMCWTDGSEIYAACASAVCEWESEVSDPASAQHAHVAEELAKAGYGNVQEAKAATLREFADSPEALERARKRIEDELVEWRDNGMSMLRRNGLAIHNRDGSPSGIIRFGFEDGVRIALKAEADMIDALNDSEGHALVQAIHDRKAQNDA